MGLLPFKELAEQGLAIFRSIGTEACLILAQELFESVANLACRSGAAVAVEPFLCGPETHPPGQRRVDRHFLPLRMEWRLLQQADLAEERVDEVREPAIAFRFTGPIEDG